jgi:hypothetical protein
VQGVNHLYQLLRKQEDELLAARDRFAEFKVKVAEREEALQKEIAEMAVEARESATISVVESMYDMATEALAAGFTLPTWNIKEWAKMLGKPEETEKPTGERAGKEVVQEAGAGGSGVAAVGDEGEMNA